MPDTSHHMPTDPQPDPDYSADSPNSGPGVPGKYVVLAILAFGVFTTGFMWVYTYLTNKPYIPLRHALVEKYTRQSSPRVEGGQERGRGPEKLRIVLTVDFNPAEDTPEMKARREGMERDTIELARKHLDLTPYEKWEFILIRYNAEGLPQRWESKRTMAEVREVVPPSPPTQISPDRQTRSN